MSNGITFSKARVGTIPVKRPFRAVLNAWFFQSPPTSQPSSFLAPPSRITEI